MTTIIRRRKLGRTSCRAMPFNVWRSDRPMKVDDTFIRWGCTANLPEGAKVFNTAKAIHLVNNKIEFRRILNAKGLCPLTWFTGDEVPEREVEQGVITRPKTHSRGRDVFLNYATNQLNAVRRMLGESYTSRYIKKVAEYRVFVVQGRAIAVANKIPDNADAIAWNVAKGGRFENVRWDDWNLKAVRIAIEAFNLSGLHFGGVDIMIDEQGEAYVLEINSAPSLTSPYRQQCMAKALQYMVDSDKLTIPLIEERGGYSKFIHPAISDKAILIGE